MHVPILSPLITNESAFEEKLHYLPAMAHENAHDDDKAVQPGTIDHRVLTNSDQHCSIHPSGDCKRANTFTFVTLLELKGEPHILLHIIKFRIQTAKVFDPI